MACVADVVFLIKTIFLKIIIILIFRSMSVGMNYLKYFGVPHHRLANLFFPENSRTTVIGWILHAYNNYKSRHGSTYVTNFYRAIRRPVVSGTSVTFFDGH